MRLLERIRERFRFGLIEVVLEAHAYWSAPVGHVELEVDEHTALLAVMRLVLIFEAVGASAVYTILRGHGQL